MLDVRAALTAHWDLAAATVSPLGGGMNSETWLVEHAGRRWVAKAVRADDADALRAGAEAATTLAAAGFVTGAPVPTVDGRLVVDEVGLALLEHVPGRELDGDSATEQAWIAATLAGVHRAGGPAAGPGTSTFARDWLDPAAPGVADHPWLVDAIAQVRRETDPLALTWTLLHADPAPGAFVHDEATGVTGLIDWAGTCRGPALYDVASAVMYLGGRAHAGAFLEAYAAAGPLEVAELAHLTAFSRVREAVQGVYFAGRIAADDLTGGIDRSDNERGLADARRRWDALAT